MKGVRTKILGRGTLIFFSNSRLDFNNDKEESANQSNFGAYKNTNLIIKTAE